MCGFIVLVLLGLVPHLSIGYNEDLPATDIDPAYAVIVSPEDLASGSMSLRSSGSFVLNFSISCGTSCNRYWPDAECNILLGCTAGRPQHIVFNEWRIYIDDALFVNSSSPSFTNNLATFTYGGNGTENLGDGSHEILIVVSQDIYWYDDPRGDPFGDWQLIEDYETAISATVVVDSLYYTRQAQIRRDVVFWITICVGVTAGAIGIIYLVAGIRESYFRINCERVAGSKDLREFFGCDRLIRESDE